MGVRKGPSIAMLARMSADLRIQIGQEGRQPEAILIVFPEPTRAGETAVRALQYAATSERLDQVISATAEATKPSVIPKRRGSRTSHKAAAAAEV